MRRPNITRKSIITIFLFLLLCMLAWRLFFYKSPAEKLEAFNAAHSLPDSKNAATIYNRFFKDYNESVISPAFLNPSTQDYTLKMPWTSEDYPELAEWIENNFNQSMEEIITASEIEDCFFPIVIEDYNDRVNTERVARKYTFMIISSANNDIAEGRIDKALDKYACCIHIGRHFRQQPLAIDFLTGISIESIGVQKIRYAIMYEDITEEQLKTIEEVLSHTNFQFDKYWDEMLYVEYLFGRLMPQTHGSKNLLTRLQEWWDNLNQSDTALERVKELYQRFLSDRQGSQIMVGLRLHKNNTGHWPEYLDEIKPFLPSDDILIEPQNNGSLNYKLNSDNFSLYDDQGKLIWPLQITLTNTNTPKSDPNEESNE